MTQQIGLYIHVPFCVSKCPYCDFYSLPGHAEDAMEAYTQAVCRSLEQWHTRLAPVQADTLYFGGGTPSLLGGKRLACIIEKAAGLFGLGGGEITMEANPGDNLGEVFSAFAAAGGNRVSLGMQSSSERELALLGRRHTSGDVDAAVAAAHAAGIENISLDIMLGIEGQTLTSIASAVKNADRLGAKHVSAYLLKIEEGTPFFAHRESMTLPDEEQQAEMYLSACEEIERRHYRQYEISNFARPDFESRHNRKYWNSDPYLGIGPSAHSFLNGHRFYYPRDLAAFLAGGEPTAERSPEEASADGAIAEGSEEEYILLRLRLNEGVTRTGFQARFGRELPCAYDKRAAGLPSELVTADGDGIRLTRRGFLLSNTLTARILG